MLRRGVRRIKDCRKVLWLLIVGLFTAVLLYPLLHEWGHSLATVILGGKVIEFHLFPLPNVLCDGRSVGNTGLAVVGLCGMLTPFLLSLMCRPKCFTLWYIVQLVKGISSLAFALSLVSLSGPKYAVHIADDDILTVLRFWPDGKGLCTVMMTGLLLLAVYSICRQNPIQQVCNYFHIK